MKAVAMTLAVLAALADAAPQAYHPDHPDTRRRTQEAAYHPDHPDTRRRTQEAAYHPDHPDTRRRTQEAAYHPDHPDTRRLEATESWARTSEQNIPNMNGEYVIGNNKEFPTNYMSYPGGVESFDAYHGPITSTSVAPHLPSLCHVFIGASCCQVFAGLVDLLEQRAAQGHPAEVRRQGHGDRGRRDGPGPQDAAGRRLRADQHRMCAPPSSLPRLFAVAPQRNV